MGFCVRSLIVAGAALCATPSLSATVVVGMPDWPSAQVTAHIIAGVLDERLDVDVRLREMGTVEIFDAIDRGEVDVHPELWLPNLQPYVDEYADNRGTVRLSQREVTASQHLCTTAQTAQSTGLRRVADLADPIMAQKFDTDMDGRGEIWIGDRTWSSTAVERVRAKSYGYDETMMLLTMPEAVAMAGVDAAVATGENIVFYCYAPHHLFALHDVVQLEEPAHDPETWSILTPAQDPAWLAKSKAASAWEPSSFRVAYATDLTEGQPEVSAFLDRIALTTQEAAEMSYAIQVERRSPEEVAAEWIAANADRIEEWTQ